MCVGRLVANGVGQAAQGEAGVNIISPMWESQRDLQWRTYFMHGLIGINFVLPRRAYPDPAG